MHTHSHTEKRQWRHERKITPEFVFKTAYYYYNSNKSNILHLFSYKRNWKLQEWQSVITLHTDISNSYATVVLVAQVKVTFYYVSTFRLSFTILFSYSVTRNSKSAFLIQPNIRVWRNSENDHVLSLIAKICLGLLKVVVYLRFLRILRFLFRFYYY